MKKIIIITVITLALPSIGICEKKPTISAYHESYSACKKRERANYKKMENAGYVYTITEKIKRIERLCAPKKKVLRK